MNIDFFSINFFPVIGICFVLIFLWKNSRMEKDIKVLFYRLAVFILLEDTLYNLELLLPLTDCAKEWLTLVTALGYTLRPVLLYMLISIIIRRDNRKRIRLPLFCPVIVCAISSFSAFFTDIAYSYDDMKVFHRGILGWTPHIIMVIYLLAMIILSFTHKGKTNKFERTLIIEITMIIIVAVVAESVFGNTIVLRTAITAVLIFYYMFFQSQIYMDKIIEEQKRQIEMEAQFSIQIVTTLAEAVDAKDPYTKGHSYRVAEYSREIARRMGMKDDDLRRIYYMGMLHDVGKIGISDTIINKTEKLTRDEYELIKSHPIIGEDVLRHVTVMPTLYYGARWHHERFDGKGYPDGLKGEEIPLEVRIISVADVFDAMTSIRTYRAPLTMKEAKKEITDAKGTQLDPEICDVMLKMIDEADS